MIWAGWHSPFCSSLVPGSGFSRLATLPPDAAALRRQRAFPLKLSLGGVQPRDWTLTRHGQQLAHIFRLESLRAHSGRLQKLPVCTRLDGYGSFVPALYNPAADC